MNQEQWTAVDNYISDMLVGGGPVLDAVLAASAAAGLPQIQVTLNQSKLLNLLAQVQGAHTILEIGTLGGYSTTWVALELTYTTTPTRRASEGFSWFRGVPRLRFGLVSGALSQRAMRAMTLRSIACDECLPSYFAVSVVCYRKLPGLSTVRC
jgi:hypothetical protein